VGVILLIIFFILFMIAMVFLYTEASAINKSTQPVLSSTNQFMISAKKDINKISNNIDRFFRKVDNAITTCQTDPSKCIFNNCSSTNPIPPVGGGGSSVQPSTQQPVQQGFTSRLSPINNKSNRNKTNCPTGNCSQANINNLHRRQQELQMQQQLEAQRQQQLAEQRYQGYLEAQQLELQRQQYEAQQRQQQIELQRQQQQQLEHQRQQQGYRPQTMNQFPSFMQNNRFSDGYEGSIY
jgi:hypothetical protein